MEYKMAEKATKKAKKGILRVAFSRTALMLLLILLLLLLLFYFCFVKTGSHLVALADLELTL